MRKANIQYPNLRAELAREGIGVCELAEKIGINRDTLARKLSGRSALNLDEAINIQKALFPELTVEYLFA